MENDSQVAAVKRAKPRIGRTGALAQTWYYCSNVAARSDGLRGFYGSLFQAKWGVTFFEPKHPEQVLAGSVEGDGMRGIAVVLIGALGFAGWVLPSGNLMAGSESVSRTPVVVELFTSEGCSSCPPADLLLQKFDAQPIAGAELIVLSEHVDYWNHLGWADPYSSAAYSDRQSAYGKRLQLESVYTPQMIVDGNVEFVGSDASQAQKALQKAAAAKGKLSVRVSDVRVENGAVRAHVEASPLPASTGKADVVFMIALNHAESQVARGENSGRRLTHVAVVRSLSKAGSFQTGQGFSQDVAVKLDKGADPQLRVVALVQESGQGKILGAAMEKVNR